MPTTWTMTVYTTTQPAVSIDGISDDQIPAIIEEEQNPTRSQLTLRGPDMVAIIPRSSIAYVSLRREA